MTVAEEAAKVAANVRKDAENTHAGYKYASADAIYAHARPALLAAGVMPYQTELEFELFERSTKQGHRTWARVVYGLALLPDGHGTPEDERQMDLERVTVLVQVTGAQTMAAARTYALKYWLRGKLMLATGDLDEDIDHQPKSRPQANPQPQAEVEGWTDAKALRLYERLVEYGMRRGQAKPAIDEALADRYGSADPRHWTDQQRDQAARRVK